LLILPAFVLFNIAAVPDAALSGTIYSLTGSAIILYFIAAHFIYGYHRSPQPAALTVGFSLFLLATAMLCASDNIAIGTATRGHTVILASNHDKSLEELRSRLGASVVTFTGEDIYNARCSACHLFDQKKVGPPYFETVPKYEGKKEELIAFILNPTRKNSDYPPMPNQGLKPAEGDSVANYILRRIASFKQQPVK
jgi:cytochrome c